MSLPTEIKRRRTFGIISHPDAGKTTLTEKLLLFGGAIQEAGAVKSNKVKKGATSDFMEIERQRGISVATSVLAFEYKGIKINILDTPGHKDFAEDTFRTLTAVDSVIVVIDVAKGVEEQTIKLVEVCRMREIPVIVFINKLDREGKDAFDLFSAAFPAGTLVGAPKVRAMELIDDIEPNLRGVYGGTVGYFGKNGDMDQAIAIRTIVFSKGKYCFQAGAGIVADSIADSEYKEVLAKSEILRTALKMVAEGME